MSYVKIDTISCIVTVENTSPPPPSQTSNIGLPLLGLGLLGILLIKRRIK